MVFNQLMAVGMEARSHFEPLSAHPVFLRWQKQGLYCAPAQSLKFRPSCEIIPLEPIIMWQQTAIKAWDLDVPVL